MDCFNLCACLYFGSVCVIDICWVKFQDGFEMILRKQMALQQYGHNSDNLFSWNFQNLKAFQADGCGQEGRQARK